MIERAGFHLAIDTAGFLEQPAQGCQRVITTTLERRGLRRFSDIVQALAPLSHPLMSIAAHAPRLNGPHLVYAEGSGTVVVQPDHSNKAGAMSSTIQRYQWKARPPQTPANVRGKPWLVSEETARDECERQGLPWEEHHRLFAPFPETPRRAVWERVR